MKTKHKQEDVVVEEDGTNNILNGVEFAVHNRREEEHSVVEEDGTTKILDGFQAAAQEAVKAKHKQERTVVDPDPEEDGTTKILNGFEFIVYNKRKEEHIVVEVDRTTKILDGFHAAAQPSTAALANQRSEGDAILTNAQADRQKAKAATAHTLSSFLEEAFDGRKVLDGRKVALEAIGNCIQLDRTTDKRFEKLGSHYRGACPSSRERNKEWPTCKSRGIPLRKPGLIN